jgi:hypothetical protein
MRVRCDAPSWAPGVPGAAVGASDRRLAILRSQSQATSLGCAPSLGTQDAHLVVGGRK